MFNKLIYEKEFCDAFEKEYLNNGEWFMIQLDEYLENKFKNCESEVSVSYKKIMTLFNNTKDLDYIVYEFMPKLAVYLRTKYKLNALSKGEYIFIEL